MLYVKIMSAENLPDEDQRKGYALLEAGSVTFYRVGAAPYVEVVDSGGDRRSIEVEGNVYVMSERGKTVATFSPNCVEDLACISSVEKLKEALRRGTEGDRDPEQDGEVLSRLGEHSVG